MKRPWSAPHLYLYFLYYSTGTGDRPAVPLKVLPLNDTKPLFYFLYFSFSIINFWDHSDRVSPIFSLRGTFPVDLYSSYNNSTTFYTFHNILFISFYHQSLLGISTTHPSYPFIMQLNNFKWHQYYLSNITSEVLGQHNGHTCAFPNTLQDSIQNHCQSRTTISIK